jgi:hypothetical protein
VRSEAPKAPGVQRAKPFGRLKCLPSDRYYLMNNIVKLYDNKNVKISDTPAATPKT